MDAAGFLTTEFGERLPQLSANDRYIAYVSNESGRDEVYVQSFPAGGNRVLVSVNGGTLPRWGRDGRELFYVRGDALLAVSVTTAPAFEVRSTSELFRHPGLAKDDGRPFAYDISNDGQRILLVEPVNAGTAPAPPIRVIQNWYEEFRDRK